jgi:hypothetical protein
MGGLGDAAFRIEVNTKRSGYFAYSFLARLWPVWRAAGASAGLMEQVAKPLIG